MKTLYLMQGIPGSGKTTMAEIIAEATDGLILSTDEFWYDENGRYVYVPDHIGQAHAWNQRRCVDAMQEKVETIIIDNTNIKQSEADPYITFGEMYGYEIQIISVTASYDTCVARQSARPRDRQIPDDVIYRKLFSLERLVV